VAVNANNIAIAKKRRAINAKKRFIDFPPKKTLSGQTSAPRRRARFEHGAATDTYCRSKEGELRQKKTDQS
jgi:hypothetical protein